MTPGIVSPFSQVECPICRKLIDLDPDRDSLAHHIRQKHRNEPLAQIAKVMYQALGQSVPENLDRVDFDEMASLLANTAKDVANKLGLDEYRKRLKLTR